jgi:hypothetical protein
MGRVDAPALRGTWLGSLLKVLNPVMRLLLSSPLHAPLSRWFLLLSCIGTQTGKRYVIPASYVRERTTIYVTTGDRWWRNLMRNNAVSVCVAGRWREARGVPVTDPAESIREHGRLFARHPWFRILAGVPASALRRPDVDAVRRSVSAGRTLVRVELKR